MTQSALSLEDARANVSKWFAPWIQDMDLQVEAVEHGFARLRVPANEKLSRMGGIMCGQAMMALADTAMVFAAFSVLDQPREIATVQQSTSFFRAVAGKDLICEARISKSGRTMLFGDCTLYMDGQPEKPAGQATLVYAVGGPRQV